MSDADETDETEESDDCEETLLTEDEEELSEEELLFTSCARAGTAKAKLSAEERSARRTGRMEEGE